MSSRSTFLFLLALLLVAVVTAYPDKSRRVPRSNGERALFGYCTAEDCLFGSSPAFILPPNEDELEQVQKISVMKAKKPAPVEDKPAFVTLPPKQ